MHFIDDQRGHLLGSQRLLPAWSKNDLPERADPLPISFLLAMVGVAIAAQALRIAFSLLLGFHAPLRPHPSFALHLPTTVWAITIRAAINKVRTTLAMKWSLNWQFEGRKVSERARGRRFPEHQQRRSRQPSIS